MIGTLGFDIDVVNGFDFDNNGVLYGVLQDESNSENGLYTIDILTGQAAFVNTLTARLTSLAFPIPNSLSVAGKYIDVSIYPNPTKNIFTINSLQKFEEEHSIVISNLVGEIVKQFYTTIDLSEFENGIYIIRLKIDDRTLIKKIIKH